MLSKNSIAPLCKKYEKCVPYLFNKRYLDKKKKKKKKKKKREKKISKKRSKILK